MVTCVFVSNLRTVKKKESSPKKSYINVYNFIILVSTSMETRKGSVHFDV